MPSAASVKVSAMQDKEKDMKPHSFDPTDPFKQVVTLVEHKIRNMEKRKAKLDSYKQEQEQGKELNADQLSAVAKYNVLMHSLDFARDLSKQVLQIQTETTRFFKKQLKKEQAERALAELEWSKHVMTVTNWLHRYATLPIVRDDFVNGRNGAFVLTAYQIEALDELSVVTSVGLGKDKTDNDLGIATEHFTNLADGKAKAIPNTSTTYSHMKEILIHMNDCNYNYIPAEPKPVMVDSQVSTEPMETNVSGKESAQILTQSSQYNFVEESQIDMESPDMDPAIVVVSTSATPQIITQQLATMQKVIPQSSQIGTQPDVVRHENRLHGDQSLDAYNSSSGADEVVHSNMQLQSQDVHITEQDVAMMKEWDEQDKYFGANPVEVVEGNDFMATNFSTWTSEDIRPSDVGGNNRGFRRGSGGQRPSRFQQTNSNGFQGRGGGNRYGGGSMNRWMAPQDGNQQRTQYDEYRGQGDRGDREREYKPRGMGGGGTRGAVRTLNPELRGGAPGFFSGGPRNGAPRGSQGGWRPYRGSYGYGGGSGDQ